MTAEAFSAGVHCSRLYVIIRGKRSARGKTSMGSGQKFASDKSSGAESSPWACPHDVGSTSPLEEQTTRRDSSCRGGTARQVDNAMPLQAIVRAIGLSHGREYRTCRRGGQHGLGLQHAVFLIVALLLTVVFCTLPAVAVAQLPRDAVAKSPNHA